MKTYSSPVGAGAGKILLLVPEESVRASAGRTAPRDLFVLARRELETAQRWENVLYLTMTLCYLLALLNLALTLG
jgi:hypothetical protein